MRSQWGQHSCGILGSKAASASSFPFHINKMAVTAPHQAVKCVEGKCYGEEGWRGRAGVGGWRPLLQQSVKQSSGPDCELQERKPEVSVGLFIRVHPQTFFQPKGSVVDPRGGRGQGHLRYQPGRPSSHSQTHLF